MHGMLGAKNGVVMSSWNLEEAINFVRNKEPIASEHGWHLGITRSILFKGHSENDLDLIIYKHSLDTDMALAEVIKAMGISNVIEKHKEVNIHYQDKQVFSGQWEGKKIELFLLEPQTPK